MAKVLVTGSEGFIGRALAHGLVSAGHSVRGIDNFYRGLDIGVRFVDTNGNGKWDPGEPVVYDSNGNGRFDSSEPVLAGPPPTVGAVLSSDPKIDSLYAGFRRSYYEYLQGDVRLISDVEKALRGLEFVYHLAAVSNLNIARENPLETVETNVMATANLLEVCRREGIKMVFASSEHTYGTQRRRVVTERVPPSPKEIYAASKVAAEQIVKTFGGRFTILRFGTVYGPGMRSELAIHIFLTKALKGETISIHSPGTQKRQYVFVDDIVEGCRLAMRPEADGQTINLPGSELTSVVELATLCIQLARSHSKLVFLPPRASDINSSFISSEKARKLLGWAPRVSLTEGLVRTMEWIRSTEEGAAMVESMAHKSSSQF